MGVFNLESKNTQHNPTIIDHFQNWSYVILGILLVLANCPPRKCSQGVERKNLLPG